MDVKTYPIAIIEDRYRGAYAGGKWLAIALSDVECNDHATRVSAMLAHGPSGSDPDAMEFWNDQPLWIAVGETPDKALAALQERMR